MWLHILMLLVVGHGVWTAYIPFSDNNAYDSETSDNDNSIQVELSGGTSSKFSPNLNEQLLRNKLFGVSRHISVNDNLIDGDNLQKRYPLHLDPLLPSKFWFRSGECPRAPDGAHEFFCPTPTPNGRWLCVDDHELCDGVKDCPNADDESPLVCMFYKAMQSQISFVANGITSQSVKSNSEYLN